MTLFIHFFKSEFSTGMVHYAMQVWQSVYSALCVFAAHVSKKAGLMPPLSFHSFSQIEMVHNDKNHSALPLSATPLS